MGLWRWIAVLLAPTCVLAEDWQLANLESAGGMLPRLTLVSARPITTFGEAGLQGLVSSEPPLPWQCLLDDERKIECEVDYPEAMPPATPLLIRVQAERLLDNQGEALGGAEFRIHTPLPTLMVEAARQPTDEHLFELIAPMALDFDSIRESLLAEIDGAPVDYELVDISQQDSPYHRSGNWPATVTEAKGREYQYRWYSRVERVWAVQLSRLPKAGEWLEFRLKSGLRTSEGPLLGRAQADTGDSLLVFDVPARIFVHVSCLDDVIGKVTGPEVDRCLPESGLGLHLSATPTEGSLHLLAESLPDGLRLARRSHHGPHLVRESRHDELPTILVPGSMDLYLTGSVAMSAYELAVDGRLRGYFGEAAQPETLKWQTKEWIPQAHFSPPRVALRRHADERPQLWVQGLAKTEASARSTGMDGFATTQQVQLQSDPLAPLPERSPVPLSSDRPQWIVAAHQSPLQPYQLHLYGEFGQTPEALQRMDRNARRVVVAVTDLGLHAIHQGGQLWVLVTDLESAAPVARAKIKVRDGRKVLARGRTDQDGLLILSGDLLSADSDLTLSAESNGRGAVMGLHDDFILSRLLAQTAESQRSNNRSVDGEILDRPRYALYTDKPIYRHGEKVHFRLYTQNQRAGQSVEMALLDDGSVLQRWHAELDDFAGYAGEVSLPSEGSDWGYAISVGNNQFPLAVANVYAPRVQSRLQISSGALVSGDRVPVRVELQRMSGEPLVGQSVELLGKLDDGGWDMLAEHFPGYQFIDRTERWLGHDFGPPCRLRYAALYAKFEATDSRGVGRTELPVPNIECDFAKGRLAPGPAFRLPGSSLGTQSPVFIAKRERYLGLGGLQRRWFRPGQRVSVQAIAVDVRSLSKISEQPVRLQVERLGDLATEGGSPAKPDTPQAVHQCELVTDGKTVCAWDAGAPGRYQLRMSAEGFEDQRYSFVVDESGFGIGVLGDRPRLAALEHRLAHGAPIRLRLTHSVDQGRVLLLINDDNGLRGMRWFELQRRQQELYLQPPEDLIGAVRASVLIVPAAGEGPLPSVSYLSEVLTIDQPRSALFVIEAPVDAAPGAEVAVRIVSASDQPLSLAITAFDDALSDLIDSEDMPRQIDSWASRRKALPPLVPSLHSVLWSARAYSLDGSDPSELTTVTVTGAGPINPFNQSPEFSGDLEIADRPIWTVVGGTDLPEGLRRRFDSRFWWTGDERFAPGESREFRLRLPDDLTRWRIEAVAQTKGGEIQQSHQTLEARKALVLEAESPKQLFPGDHTELVAALYCSAEEPPALDWQIAVAQSDASVTRRIRPRTNEHAELVLPFAAQQPGTQQWWSRAVSGAEAGALADGVLRQLQIRDPLQSATLRQIGLIPADGLRIDPNGLVLQPGPGELSLSVGMDPLFGLGGAVSESLKRRPWMPDNAIDQLITAVVAQKLGLAVDPEPYKEVAESLLRTHFVDGGWVYFPDHVYDMSTPLSRRIWSGLATLQSLGRQVDVPSGASFDRAWEIATHEKRHRAMILANRLGAARMRGDDVNALIDAVLAESNDSVAVNAQLALALADRTDRQAELDAALDQLRDALSGEYGARARVGEQARCLGLQALAQADRRQNAQARQLDILRQLYSPWGSALPALSSATVSQCVQSARAFAGRWLEGRSSPVVASMDKQRIEAELRYGEPPRQLSQQWSGDEPVSVHIAAPQSPLLSYEVAYERPIDLRSAPLAGKAIQIERRYRLIRDGQWLDTNATPQVGDFMQVQLQLRTVKSNGFVAVIEPLPGGIVAIDPKLNGSLDPRLEGESDWIWSARQYGDAENRFVARYLHSGLTTLTYIARVRFAGDYAWPGPQVELIYSPQVSGRGAAERLRVETAADRP